MLHESLTVLSPHQTRIQRSKILLKGAGPLSQGCVPMATWAERGGPRRRRQPCCPARSLRRRNTSTYPCCWRRQTSAPPTTPSIKVTDQILKLLAAHSPVTQRCVSEPRTSSVCGHTVLWQLFFSDSSLARPSSTSLAAGFCAKVAFKGKKKKSLPIFYGVFIAIFCSICILKHCVNCEIFFFPYKFVLQFGTNKID